eukprot:11282614-Prorocentrum_lima.AAC.1
MYFPELVFKPPDCLSLEQARSLSLTLKIRVCVRCCPLGVGAPSRVESSVKVVGTEPNVQQLLPSLTADWTCLTT